MASNITLIYPNYIDECVISETSGSAWSTALPLTNIQNKVLKKVARTNIGALDKVLKINLMNQSRNIGGIAIVAHNFTTSCKVRFEGFSQLNFGGVQRFDSTQYYRAYPIINPNDNGVIPFESRNWWLGTVEENERKSYTSVCSFFPPENHMIQSIRITIDDSPASGIRAIGDTSTSSVLIAKGVKAFTTTGSNNFYSGQLVTIYDAANMGNFMSGEIASCAGNQLILNAAKIGGSGTIANWNIINGDNYLEIGRIIIGQAIEPAHNPEYGDFSIGYTDLTEMQRASDNTKYFYIKPRMRNVSASFKHLTKAEALSGFLDAQRELGIFGELLFTFSRPEYIKSHDELVNINMTTDKNHYANTFLCNFAELNPITMAYINGYSTAIKLEEIV